MTTFGSRLKQSRLQNNLTLEELANKIGTTKSAISRYENDLRMPNGDFIKSAADTLNVSTDYLLGRTRIKQFVDIQDLDLESLEVRSIARGASELNNEERNTVMNVINAFIQSEQNKKNLDE